MRRLQILIIGLAAGLAWSALADSLNLYSKPGPYKVIGQLRAAPDQSLTLSVFGQTRNRVELRLDFPIALKSRGELIRRAASLIHQSVAISGEVSVKNGGGTLRPREIEPAPVPPPLDPAQGEGFWKLAKERRSHVGSDNFRGAAKTSGSPGEEHLGAESTTSTSAR